MISPSVRSTSRSTPCVLGCCGPMLTSISSVRTSNSMTVGSAVAVAMNQVSVESNSCSVLVAGEADALHAHGDPDDAKDGVVDRPHHGGQGVRIPHLPQDGPQPAGHDHLLPGEF